MKKELKIAGYLFSAIFFIVFAFVFIDAFHQYPNLQDAYNIKTNGREVQATIDGFHIGPAAHAYSSYVLHYTYEENGRIWTGTIRYLHKDDGSTNEDALISYYKSMIGDKVNITIDPDSTYCLLTKDVESRYNESYISEILEFSFGGVGLLVTITLFIIFLVYLKKDRKVEQCNFIANNEK